MSKRPLSPLAMAVPPAKGSAYVPEALAEAAPTTAHMPLEAEPVAQQPQLADVSPRGPAAMNFKLTPEASSALRAHNFKTGRSKQSIVEEALDQWLRKNQKLISQT